MTLSLILALALHAADRPVLVDEGVEALRTCRISALAFRTPTDGLMFDYCGAVFRSRDAGQSWSKAPEVQQALFGDASPTDSPSGFYIQRALWLNASTGLVFSYGASQVFRTDDAGRTWQVSALPDDSEMIYDVEHVGEQLWLCGSTGRVSRSMDGGRTWRAGRQLFDAAGFNPTNWCSALSFLDENDGWAAGWGTLWQTMDGGLTWTRLPPIHPLVTHTGSADQIAGLVRLNSKVAWARTRGGDRLRTTDGGKRWSKVDSPDLRPSVSRRPDGRLLVLAAGASGGRVGDLVPIAEDRWIAIGARGPMGQHLELFEGGRLVRRGPPVTPSSGRTTPLQGRTGAEGIEWGWSGGHVFRSDDEGRSWRRVGTLDAAITRLAAASSSQLIGRVGSDLYRSDDGGTSWRSVSDGAVRADWTRLTGEKDLRPKPYETLACALRGPARVAVEFGVRGCFGGSKDSLTLRIAPNGTGRLEGAYVEWDRSTRRRVGHRVERSLSRSETSKWVRQLSADVARAERPSGCQSTATIFSKLEWTCGGSPPQLLEYQTRDCSPAMDPSLASETRFGVPKQDAYSRAAGVRATAAGLLRLDASQ